MTDNLPAGKAGKKFVLLTDIVGVEDFAGDMDFKVAGTKNGITAIQLDIKIDGLTDEIIELTLERARVARMAILEKMLAVLPEPRKMLSKYAPNVHIIKIPTERIGEIIGPGGKMIRQIIAATGATVDVEDDGSVVLSGTAEGVAKAKNWVEGLVHEVTVGEEFEGEVKRILPFGAFVEILPGKEGMVHVSQMAVGFVKEPTEVVQLGARVKVRVMEIDDQHRINLSMLFGEDAKKAPAPKPRFEHHDRPRDFSRGKRRF